MSRIIIPGHVLTRSRAALFILVYYIPNNEGTRAIFDHLKLNKAVFISLYPIMLHTSEKYTHCPTFFRKIFFLPYWACSEGRGV